MNDRGLARKSSIGHVVRDLFSDQTNPASQAMKGGMYVTMAELNLT